MNYHIHEGALNVFAWTQDRSLNVLSVQLPEHEQAAQVVISRDQLEAGETLEQSVTRQLHALERQVKQLLIHSRQGLSIGPNQWPAVAVYSELKQGEHTAWQAQVAMLDRGRGAGAVLVFTLSATQALSPASVEQWWSIVQGFRPRQ